MKLKKTSPRSIVSFFYTAAPRDPGVPGVHETGGTEGFPPTGRATPDHAAGGDIPSLGGVAACLPRATT